MTPEIATWPLSLPSPNSAPTSKEDLEVLWAWVSGSCGHCSMVPAWILWSLFYGVWFLQSLFHL